MLDNWSPGMVAPGAVLVPPGGFLVLFCKNICIFSWSHSWMGTVTLRWLFMMFIIFISNTCCYDELLSDIFQWVWFKVGSVLATLPRMTLTTSDLIGFQKCFRNPAKFTKNTFLTFFDSNCKIIRFEKCFRESITWYSSSGIAAPPFLLLKCSKKTCEMKT